MFFLSSARIRIAKKLGFRPLQVEILEDRLTPSTFTLEASGGTPQTSLVNIAFAMALKATLLEDGTPVAGAKINFSAPANGSTAALSAGTVVTDSAGIANVTVTANAVGGAYSIVASFGDLSASFQLSNYEPPSIITPDHYSFVGPLSGLSPVIARGYPKPTISETGQLPTGIFFSSGGLFGNAEAAAPGDYPIVITAANGVGTPATQNFTIHVSDGTSELSGSVVRHIYSDLLNRMPEPAAAEFWTNVLQSGVSRAQVVFQIERSPSNEYQRLQVAGFYQIYLHRRAEPSGLASGIDFLNNGGTIQALAAAILGSTEYFFNKGGGSNLGFLQSLYADVFRRSIDPYALALDSLVLAQGINRTALSSMVLNSLEARQLFVTQTYRVYVGRDPDPDGLAFGIQVLQAGESYERYRAFVVGSLEYVRFHVGAEG